MGTYRVQPDDDLPPLTEEQLREHQRAAILAAQFASRPPIYSRLLVGCFVVVYAVQLLVGAEPSMLAAGLVKPLVWSGEFWRLLTSATLHLAFLPIGFLHIYFNSQALYNIGSAIEALSKRAHVSILFVLAAITGSVFSLYLMPEIRSVGASGGILGLFGFLAIFGFKHRKHLPPNFLRNVVINLLLLVGIGYIGYEYIDNAAHAGGFAAGVVYGLLFVRKNDTFGQQTDSGFLKWLGVIALIIVAVAALLSIYMMLTFTPDKYTLPG